MFHTLIVWSKEEVTILFNPTLIPVIGNEWPENCIYALLLVCEANVVLDKLAKINDNFSIIN